MNATGKPRIVSLAPNVTSILCAIGARKLLAGVTKWCADVAPVGGLPRLGDCWHAGDITEISRLRPSLVIGSVPFRASTVRALLAQPFAFLALNPRSLASIEHDIRLLGSIVGAKTGAERLIARMSSEFAQLHRATRGERPLRVYCEAWPKPRISSPPWVAEIVKLAGGEMVVPAGTKVTEDEVARARPDVILLAWAATGQRANTKGAYKTAAWRSVPAIVNRNVFVVRDEWLNTPGPPLLGGARELQRIFRSVRRMREKA